jgi:SAM-dependent methyltransferase
MTSVAAPTADPGPVWRVIQGAALYWSLRAAVQLGLFDRLADQPQPTAELAAACSADPDRLQTVLHALSLAALVADDGDGWSLTPASDMFLRRDREWCMAALVEWSPGRVANWERLADTVRGEAPVQPVDHDDDFYGRLVEATFGPQLAVARSVASTLEVGAGVHRVLDIGAGAAPWSIALLETFPNAQATINDLAAVLAAARAATARAGVSERCTYVPGDYLTAPFHSGHDVVVLGHVCRAEPPPRARALIQRAADLVSPEGCVVVTDYTLDEDRAGPSNAVILDLTMVANTSGGRAYTRSQLSGWLAAAGFDDVTITMPVPPTDVLVARRRPTTGEAP